MAVVAVKCEAVLSMVNIRLPPVPFLDQKGDLNARFTQKRREPSELARKPPGVLGQGRL